MQCRQHYYFETRPQHSLLTVPVALAPRASRIVAHALLASAALFAATPANAASPDVIDMSLEELLQVQVEPVLGMRGGAANQGDGCQQTGELAGPGPRREDATDHGPARKGATARRINSGTGVGRRSAAST